MCLPGVLSVLKDLVFIQMVAMLIINICLIVKSYPELEMLGKNASEYYFVAMKRLVCFSGLQDIRQIALHHFTYPLFFSSNFSLSTSSGIPPLKSDCVKLNTSTLPSSFSSAINFVHFSSFNSSSGNSASDLDCTIKNNVDNSSKNDQCKTGVSTFFFLCFPNDLSNGGKNRLIKIEFVPKSNCVFSITKRQFSYNCLSLHSWLFYLIILDEPHHPFCVLF